MTPDLEALLANWKNATSDAKELRTVTHQAGKSDPGEYVIILKMSVRVVDLAQSETVSVSRKIQTTGQSTGNDAADVAAVKEGAALLKDDFSKKCRAVMVRLARDHGSDCINERNPY